MTLYTAECPEPLALDGTPITVEVCDTTEERIFTLIGPAGQEAEFHSRLELGLDKPRVRAARWSVDSQDELEDEGIYTLAEMRQDPDRPTFYECLMAADGDLAPAELTYVDGGVEFRWTPAVVDSDDTEGQALVCHVYSHPVDRPDIPMPGIIRIHAGEASPEAESDLIVRAAGDEPYNLRDGRAANVPSLTYTLTDAEGGEITLTAPEVDEGIAVNSFPVPPGNYTLTVDSTGTSADVTVDSGQTVLAFNPLGEPSGAQEDATPDPGEIATPDPGEGVTLDPVETVTLDPVETVTLDPVETETLDPVETATLEPRAVADTPTPSSSDTPQVDAVETFAFTAADWQGAYPYVDTEVYQRDCVAVYGAGSPHPTGSLTFDLDRVTIGSSRLVLTGLDDEWAGGNPIVITVNGAVVFDGASPFNSWNPSDPQVAWNQAVVTFGNDLLVEGQNVIVVANASAGGSIGLPPYILLSEASVFVGLTIDAG